MKIKRISHCLPLILVFLFLGCASKAPAESKFTTLMIYHTNDIHSHLVPNNLKKGGLAYLSSVLRSLNEKQPDSLILDAGDMYKKGHLPTRETKDEAMADLVEKMPFYDARAIGNNEVKVGVEKLLRWSNTKEKSRTHGKTPLLSANFVDREGKAVFEPYMVVKKAGLKVGIIGLTYEGSFDETEGLNLQSKVDPRAPYSVANDEKSLRPIVEKLRPEVDVLILLSHETFKRNKLLAAEFPQIDLFVCGHSHTLTPAQTLKGKALLVESGEFGQQIGAVTLIFDNVTHKVYSESSTFWPIGPDYQAPDPAIAQMIQEDYKKYSPDAATPIGNSEGTLTLLQASSPIEGGLQDWAADVMRITSKADIAIVNRDMMREDLVQGPITKEDLYLAAPYEDQISIATIPKDKLEAMLTDAMNEDYHKLAMMPFAFSGLKAVVNIDNVKDEITKLVLKFPSRKSNMTVAFPAFMLKHCTKYFAEKFCPVIPLSTSGSIPGLLAEFVKSHPVVEVPEGERIMPIYLKEVYKASDDQ